MKKLFFALVFFALASGMAIAQDFPRFEVFGGYSILKSDTGIDEAEGFEGEIPIFDDVAISNIETSNWQKAGFAASFTYNATAMFGIEAAFRYNSGNVLKMDVTVEEVTVPAEAKLKDFSFGAGPKFTFRNSSAVTPFAHVLIGFDNMKVDVSASSMGESMEMEALSETGFGLTLGGGVDVRVNDNFAVRVVQADYYMTNHMDDTQNNFVLSFGAVFGFGN